MNLKVQGNNILMIKFDSRHPRNSLIAFENIRLKKSTQIFYKLILYNGYTITKK